MEMDGNSKAPRTGPEAIEHALNNMTVDDLETRAKEILSTGKKTRRSEAVALLNIAKGMRRNELSPSAYMMSSVPVIPPKYRPFAVQGDALIPGDANVLYKDLFDIRDAYNEEREMFGDENVGQSRLALYDAVRAVSGHGDPVKPKTKAKEIKGFLKKIVGTTAKHSFFQSKMIAKTQDNVGRSTITVNPELGIDEIELPEEMAFTMYAPYVQKRLKQLGLTDAEALRQTKDRSEYARHALDQVMSARPVVYSRAPSWHKHSVLGAHAKIHSGKEIRTNPYVAAGLGADYDGDQQIASVKVACKVSDAEWKRLQTKPLAECSLEEKVIKDIISKAALTSKHGEEASVYREGLWVNVPLDRFPHTMCIGVRKDDVYDITFFAVPDRIRVKAYAGGCDPVAVHGWSIHKGKCVEIVTLENGRQIITDDDPRAVFGITDDTDDLRCRRFTPTEALEKGVYVPCEIHPFFIEEPEHTVYYDEEAGIVTSKFMNASKRKNSKLDASLGKKMGAEARTSSSPAVPAWAVHAPCSFRHGFIQGLLGDNSNNTGEIVIKTSSLMFAQSVATLLRSFNAMSTVTLLDDTWAVKSTLPTLKEMQRGVELAWKWTRTPERYIVLPKKIREALIAHMDRFKMRKPAWIDKKLITANEARNIDMMVACVTDAKLFAEWSRILRGGMTFCRVVDVEKTGKVETGYDLTVPGYETFMSADGIILSNTINVHVPSSDAAVKETYEKLMPSKTPHSDRIAGKIVPLPKQEQILGLYTAATAPAKETFTFNTEQEAIDAIRRGRVPLSAEVNIVNPSPQLKVAAADEEKKKLLDEVGPARHPRTGKYMPTVRENVGEEIPVKKAASKSDLVLTLKGIVIAGDDKGDPDLSVALPGTKLNELAVDEAVKAANAGNIKPAMRLIRKFGNYSSSRFVLGCREACFGRNG